MAKYKYDPKRDLRAWAEALNAVADLQQEIERESTDYTLTSNWAWQDPYRALVKAAMRTWPERFKESERYENAIGLKETAQTSLEEFKKEAAQYRGETLPELIDHV